jgi:NAD(P)-dependent dehydrogenase (short-subunit alcohol dehydrogenase family)
MGAPLLEGQVAIVTGGSRGIGSGICKVLAGAGATVAVNYRGNRTEAERTVDEIVSLGGQAFPVQGDVARKADADQLIKEVYERCGRIDILVNNAGICPFRDFLDIDEQTWRETIDTNLSGAFFCSQAAARIMIEQGNGSIINISTVTSFRGGKKQVHYAASKGGMNALTSSIANALGPQGVRINTIFCGGVITDINRHLVSEEKQLPKAKDKGLPLQRLGDPHDLGQAVLFFASAQSEWVTGAQLAVDGGWSIL